MFDLLLRDSLSYSFHLTKNGFQILVRVNSLEFNVNRQIADRLRLERRFDWLIDLLIICPSKNPRGGLRIVLLLEVMNPHWLMK